MNMCPVCYFKFCKVVWRRYLGEVGKFNHTLWLIYPRHCTPISIKIGQHLLKLCTKVVWCVFHAPQCIFIQFFGGLRKTHLFWNRMRFRFCVLYKTFDTQLEDRIRLNAACTKVLSVT